jgi:hypothetical protein
LSGKDMRISNPLPGESPDLAIWTEMLGPEYAAEIAEHKAAAEPPKKITAGALVAKAVSAALLKHKKSS